MQFLQGDQPIEFGTYIFQTPGKHQTAMALQTLRATPHAHPCR